MENIRILNRMKEVHGDSITLGGKVSEASNLPGIEIGSDGDVITRITISKGYNRHYILGATEHSQHHGVVDVFFTVTENGELNYLGNYANEKIEYYSDINYIAEQVEQELNQYVSEDTDGNIIIERK